MDAAEWFDQFEREEAAKSAKAEEAYQRGHALGRETDHQMVLTPTCVGLVFMHHDREVLRRAQKISGGKLSKIPGGYKLLSQRETLVKAMKIIRPYLRQHRVAELFDLAIAVEDGDSNAWRKVRERFPEADEVVDETGACRGYIVSWH
jgi:hypothetical protein